MPGGFIANYARRTTAPRRDGLRPRGCRLVLLQSVCAMPVCFKNHGIHGIHGNAGAFPRFAGAHLHAAPAPHESGGRATPMGALPQ